MGERTDAPMDGDLLEDLRRVDRPMAASAEFDARLRNELFGDGVALQPKRRSTPSRPKVQVLVAAAAVLLAVVVGTLFVAGQDDRQDAVDGTGRDPVTTSTIPSVDAAAARSACQTFSAQAFGGLTQVQVAGPNNATYLPTLDAVVAAATTLDGALVELRDDLGALGLRDPDFTAQVDRARRSLALAVQTAAESRLPNAQEQMGQMDEHLERMASALTEQGVTGCV